MIIGSNQFYILVKLNHDSVCTLFKLICTTKLHQDDTGTEQVLYGDGIKS